MQLLPSVSKAIHLPQQEQVLASHLWKDNVCFTFIIMNIEENALTFRKYEGNLNYFRDLNLPCMLVHCEEEKLQKGIQKFFVLFLCTFL